MRHRATRNPRILETSRDSRGGALVDLSLDRCAHSITRLNVTVTIPHLAMQVSGAIPTSFPDMVRSASPFTQGVLVLLAILSLISWTIMFAVWRQLAKAGKAADHFASEFESTNRLDDAGTMAKRAIPNALTKLFLRAIHFVSDIHVANQQIREQKQGDGAASSGATLSGSQIEALYLVLESEASAERSRLGHFIPWLATIGSASPLIGLFGTVLGIIESFIGIATRGSGNLSAVAPGVAVALIATAAALAVAIPATFGYNIFANRLNRFDQMMENFGTTVIARLVREGYI